MTRCTLWGFSIAENGITCRIEFKGFWYSNKIFIAWNSVECGSVVIAIEFLFTYEYLRKVIYICTNYYIDMYRICLKKKRNVNNFITYFLLIKLTVFNDMPYVKGKFIHIKIAKIDCK